jgi:hypothetical protein
MAYQDEIEECRKACEAVGIYFCEPNQVSLNLALLRLGSVVRVQRHGDIKRGMDEIVKCWKAGTR